MGSSETAEDPPQLKLILASGSPRRVELLRAAGYEFTQDPADIDESKYPPGSLPSDVAIHLAREKARAVAERHPESVILAADTVVAFGDTLLGKPADSNDARRMLRLLAGTTHIVITGVAVMHAIRNHLRIRRVMSAVRMRTLFPNEIERYIETGHWQGKAGGYGIQDSDPFVKRMTGCHTNIVGLPMTTTKLMLEEAGICP